MGRKKIAGLVNRNGIWHIEKRYLGRRIRESTGTGDIAQAEIFFARRLEELRQAKVYGVRPKRLFRDAAIKYLVENQHKTTLGDDKRHLKKLDKFIGTLTIDAIHMGSLTPFIEARKKEGVKMGTINHALKVVRHLLNMAATEWVDENGLTWLLVAPKVKLLSESDSRKPQPLSWQEQEKLFAALPVHLRRMALFAVNTGCRDAEICSLKWEWEVKVPELNASVFIIPGKHVKNRDDRLVVLNGVAKQVIEEVRGMHPEHVFTYGGKRILRMNNSAWKRARMGAELSVRVHDLKHTFGRRLRAAGVSFEDRQDLLGHRSARITTHYSSAELSNLLSAANKVYVEKEKTPHLTLLRTAA
jgi:integrase